MKDFLKMLIEKVEQNTVESWETDIILKMMCEYEHKRDNKEMNDMSCYSLGWYIYKLKKDIK
jgi:hypothetical protein